MNQLFNRVYQGKTVLVTGHTGFKGSWLAIWLRELGANVIGFSLPTVPTNPSNFEVTGLSKKITDVRGDLRELESLVATINQYKPEVIFHLGAQPIVLQSVADPVGTFTSNVNGTINVLEAVRQSNCVRAVVAVTTDKVYENQDWLWGYRENDRLGGKDPYSASKAMAELAIAAYRSTYFPAERYDEHGVAVASTRAGNVIGGGDFGAYRLVPDTMRALLAGDVVGLRMPGSIRPWQHVLEPLSGYLWLGAMLLENGPAYAEAWNFGPMEQKGVTAQAITEKIIEQWGSGSWTFTGEHTQHIETGQLRLSWDKAAACLNWRPVYSWVDAVTEIVTWFKSYEQGLDMYQVCREHIETYVERAMGLGLPWICEND